MAGECGSITENLIEESTKKDEKIQLLECRLQDITESKDLIHKELDENNCWYDNQQHLIKELEKANQHTAELELVNKQHLELQQTHNEQHGKGKCRKLFPMNIGPQPERMSITNAVVTEFFRKHTGK